MIVPNISDMLLFRTFDTIAPVKQAKEIDFPYTPVQPYILDGEKKPQTVKEVKTLEKTLDKASSSNSGTIGTYQPRGGDWRTGGLRSDFPFDDSHDEDDLHTQIKLLNPRVSGVYHTFATLHGDLDEMGIRVEVPLSFDIMTVLGALATGLKIAKSFLSTASDVNQVIDDVHELSVPVGKKIRRIVNKLKGKDKEKVRNNNNIDNNKNDAGKVDNRQKKKSFIPTDPSMYNNNYFVNPSAQYRANRRRRIKTTMSVDDNADNSSLPQDKDKSEELKEESKMMTNNLTTALLNSLNLSERKWSAYHHIASSHPWMKIEGSIKGRTDPLAKLANLFLGNKQITIQDIEAARKYVEDN